MKELIFCSFLLFSTLVLSNASNTPLSETAAPVGDQAEIKFEFTSHNFGEIKQGESVSFVFKCRNTGNRPLIITWVDTPCGCTSKDWTKNPIFPGGIGEVTVTYNSAGRTGSFNKTVTVVSNAKSGKTELIVKGTIIKPATAQ